MNQNHNELIEQIKSLKDQLKKKAFDKEEQDLINGVCERVGKIIERIQTNEQFKEVEQANIQVRSAIKDRYRFQNIIGMGLAMQNVYDQILTAAKSDANVSI